MIERVCSLIKMTVPERNRGLLYSSGTVVPADETDGYQTGCLFQHTDGASGTALYINEGSVTSCDFNPVDAGDLDTVLEVGEFASLESGSGIPLSSSQTAAAVVYGDDNGLAITANVYNFRTRLLLTVDQSATSIRALMAQLKLADGVDVATGIYTASQGYLELAGTHIAEAGATLSCMDASLEVGTLLTVDADGEACGLHVETTGGGTITNNGTCAGILIDKAVGAASWPIGVYVVGETTHQAFKAGVQGTGVGTTTAYPFAVEVHNEAGADIAAGDTGSSAGIYNRYEIAVAQTSQCNHISVFAKLRVKANMADGVHCGVYGLVEASGTTVISGTADTMTAAGHFALDFGANLDINTGHLNGIVVDSSVDDSADIALTDMSAIRVKKSSGSHEWPVGLQIEPTAVDVALKIGTASYAASGTAIPLDGTTIHSGAEVYFDDGGVKLEAGYTEAWLTGFLVSTEITDAAVSCSTVHDYMYIAANVETSGTLSASWSSLLVKTGMTITASGSVADFPALHLSVDVPSGATIGASTFACGLSIGGQLMGTHTGNAVGFRLRPANGNWDGLCDITSQVTGGSNGSGDDVYINCFIDGVAARIAAKYVS